MLPPHRLSRHRIPANRRTLGAYGSYGARGPTPPVSLGPRQREDQAPLPPHQGEGERKTETSQSSRRSLQSALPPPCGEGGPAKPVGGGVPHAPNNGLRTNLSPPPHPTLSSVSSNHGRAVATNERWLDIEGHGSRPMAGRCRGQPVDWSGPVLVTGVWREPAAHAPSRQRSHSDLDQTGAATAVLFAD